MAQVEYIRLDVDFFDKPKIKGLQRKHGHKAILLILRLYCAMGRATNATLNRDSWEALAADGGYEDGEAIIVVDYCLGHGILSGDYEQLTNTRVVEDQAALERKREQAKARQKSFREKPKELESPTTLEVISTSLPKSVPIVLVEPTQQRETIDPGDNENLKIALEKLQSPGNQQWTLDNRFVNAGRRPMKDYPELWLTPFELEDIIKKLKESDIPMTSYKDLFAKAEAKLKTWKQERRSTSGVSVYNWLTGFLFQEVLETTIKETRLAKTLETERRVAR